jgi:L-threonylcarbamoyladenylate synthase
MSDPFLWRSNRSGLVAAAAAVAAGGVIGLPTDTVYGLGAGVRFPESVARIAEIKGRPASQPLILMTASLEELEGFASFEERARELGRRFWPGPLTLILPALGPAATLGGRATVGVRIPGHDVALQLLRKTGPMATTSANRHGLAPVLGAAEALAELPGLAGALAEGGQPRGMLEPSSILDLSQKVPVLVRAGRLGATELGLALSAASPEGRRD